jgi:hypothetical protein
MTRFHNGCEPNGEFSHHFAKTTVQAIEKMYGALISAARKEWERRFTGRDPADACVNVRISGAEPKEERSRVFPLEVYRARAPFVTN